MFIRKYEWKCKICLGGTVANEKNDDDDDAILRFFNSSYSALMRDMGLKVEGGRWKDD